MTYATDKRKRKSVNAFEKCLDFMSLNAMKATAIALLHTSCTNIASQKRLGI